MDPLNPMENTEFLGQLSQYSSLEQLMNLNESFGTNNNLTASVYNSMMTNLIGKDVTVQGNVLHWSEDSTARLSYYSQGGDVTVEIADSNGLPVRTLNLGAQTVGEQMLSWDGKDDGGQTVPDGSYLVKVTTQVDEETQVLPTYIIGRVTGVQYAGGSPVLYVGNQVVNPADIVAIYESQTPASD